MRDFHAHSNYSDGTFLFRMVDAAAAAGLDGIGFADHCTISERPAMHEARAEYGFTLDETYERRRRGIERLRKRAEIDVYDAVEMDYDPRDEDAIAAFLDDAGFDYAIGSVHRVTDENVQSASAFDGLSDERLDEIVAEYYDALIDLVNSELFDVAAHVDLPERTEPLRGRATEAQYRAVAEAFASSRTVPEINAGRAVSAAEIVHPQRPFFETLREYDVSFTLGTDSHRPGEVGDRVAFLTEFVAEHELDPVKPPSMPE